MATPSPESKLEDPNWLVHCTAPAASYLRTKTSCPPALDWPAKVPLVEPATYTPVASTATPRADSDDAVPNWRVHTSFPAVSYLRTKASCPPALDCSGKAAPELMTPAT